MRIERLDLLSYGPFHDVSLDIAVPGGGLTVVLGPNEAGKSTALRALRSMLYGFPRGTTDDFGRGRASLKLGARLRGADGSAHDLVRQAAGRPALVTAAGNPVDEAMIAALLGDVDRALFTSLFTINHEELHNGSQDLLDADGELGRLVFSASLGGGRLRAVAARLEARAGELFTPRGRLQTIPASLQRYRAQRAEVKRLQTKSREWDRLRQARDAADANVEALRGKLSTARVERDRLVRLRAALPLLAVRAEANDRLAELDVAGPVQSKAWAVRCDELRADHAAAVTRRDEQASAVARLETQIAHIDVSTALLDAADRIDRLLQRTERYRKDADDLPLRKGELAAAASAIAVLLEHLGLTADVAAGVTDAQLATIAQLADRHAAADAAVSAATRELHDTEDQVQVLAEEGGRLREPLDVDELRQRVEAAQPAGAVVADMASEGADVESLRGDLEVGLARLGLAPDADIERLIAPTSAAVQSHTDRRATLSAEIAGLEVQIDDCRGDLERIEADRTAVVQDPAVPDPEALGAARIRRQQGWALVRAAWLEGGADQDEVNAWTGGEPLPGAYEAAVVAADEAADARFDEAAQVQMLLELARQSQTMTERRDRLEAELVARRGELDTLDAAWTMLWTEAGLDPVERTAAASRLDEISGLQTLAAGLRRRRDALVAREKTATHHRQSVGDSLRAVGIEPADEDLAVLLAQARELVDAEQKAAASRDDIERRSFEAEQSRAARAKAVEIATDELGDWAVAWSTALTAANLPAETMVDVAREVVSDLRELRSAQRSADGLRRRVEGIQRDMGAFEEATRALLEELAPDIAGTDLLDGLAHMKRLLDDARNRWTRHQTLAEQLDDAQALSVQAEQRAERLGEELVDQRRAAGIGPDEPLDSHIERARAGADLRARREDAETKLLDQGAGLTVAGLEAAADVYEGDIVKVDAAERELSERIDEFEEEFGMAREALNDARRAFEEVDGSDRAANVEQDAEVELASLANATDTYARVAIASEVLRQVVADYGRQHKAPIIDRAIALFSQITEDAFRGLVVDVDGERRLQACRRNGQYHDLDELSDGTLDQLYLALRLAGIEHHLDRITEPVPVVLDDALVNFDDNRAAAAIDVLADLGQRTQVLLFTHHRHVVTLAKNEIEAGALGLVELAARDHDEVAVSAPAPMRAEGTVRSAAGDGEYDGAVLAVLREAGEPLRRGEIVERTGMDDAAWTQTIRRLVDSGVVIQTGTRRGARYQLC